MAQSAGLISLGLCLQESRYVKARILFTRFVTKWLPFVRGLAIQPKAIEESHHWNVLLILNLTDFLIAIVNSDNKFAPHSSNLGKVIFFLPVPL